MTPTLFLSAAYQTLSEETVIGRMLILSSKIVSVFTLVKKEFCNFCEGLQEISKIESNSSRIDDFFIITIE
jgi:hypothetical protein